MYGRKSKGNPIIDTLHPLSQRQQHKTRQKNDMNEKTVTTTISESELKALIDYHQNMRRFYQRQIDTWTNKEMVGQFQIARNMHLSRIVELAKSN